MNPPKTFCKGQMFLREFQTGASELYVLAITGIDGDGDPLMNLINIKNGDRWTQAIATKKCTLVTDIEMEKLYRGQKFKPVTVEEIEVRYISYKTVRVKV